MPEPQTSQTPPVDFSDLGGKKLQEPPKFDSGKVISVAHPNGDLHSIALPEDTDPAEFHQALSDSGYHFPSTAVKPTREGSLEFNPAFRAQAAAAYGKSLNGRMANREAAFSVGRDGKMSPITVHDSKPGETPTDTFSIQFERRGDLAQSSRGEHHKRSIIHRYRSGQGGAQSIFNFNG
jgi:hypothetical protein